MAKPRIVFLTWSQNSPARATLTEAFELIACYESMCDSNERELTAWMISSDDISGIVIDERPKFEGSHDFAGKVIMHLRRVTSIPVVVLGVQNCKLGNVLWTGQCTPAELVDIISRQIRQAA